MKIVILVEGQTEKSFMEALRKFLVSRLQGNMPKLMPQPYDGRIPKGEKLRRVVENYSREVDAVIALTDVYTGTADFHDATDAKKKMSDWVGENPKFFPHVAQYDFEAWLLPFWSTIQKLAKHNKQSPGIAPENVNHGKPLAAHIKEIFEIGKGRYSDSKPRDAKRILKENDLATSAEACPELRAFLNTILQLCRAQPI